jgi:DNA polymerase-3 subunit alpha
LNKFVSLHHHSTYSYLDGYGMPDQHIARTVEMEQWAQALTEHGNVSSHVKHEQAAVKAGIKPLFGIEAYTGAVGEDAGRFKWHLTILAENAEGYRNLLRLTSRGWAEGFYYEPTVSGEMLADHSEGLVVLSGCSGSLLACTLLGGKGTPEHHGRPDLKAAIKVAKNFQEIFGDRYYLEVQQFPELERTRAMNEAYQTLSEKTGIPLVATCDVHYPYPDDNEMQVILHAVDRGGKNNTFEKQQQSWGYDVRLTTWDDRTLMRRMRDTGLSKKSAASALANTGVIAERCTVTLPKMKALEFPSKKDSLQMLWAWVKKGWKYRGFDKFPKDRQDLYRERIKYEMELITMERPGKPVGFSDYLLVVSDIIKWAKDSQIPVGPARGSAAASLVCYALRITEVDPMLFPNLLFERFIDINRHDDPDIDVDFSDDDRWRIRDYCVRKYGEECVGNIGTFTKYKGKNSLTDVGKVRRVPYEATETVKSMLIERSSGDLRATETIEDTMDMFPKVKEIFRKYPALKSAQRLEGNLRGFSVHAAGLVIANEPLTNACAVYTRRDPKTQEIIGNVLSIDKYDAEHIGALKLDALGLTTMGVIDRILKMIGMTLEELYAVPLDDPEVIQGFKDNKVVGLFQFDGRAMRSVNREVKPDNFDEICDINALARPGPLHSGATSEYIMAKHGKKKIEKLHPVVTRITQHTQGQIVYQEQILQVVRELGGFSWEEAARIRKIISKKQGEQEFNRQMGKFMEGAKERGVPTAKAAKIWKQLVTAGAYAFNAAHCVSYGMLGYWTMWLKIHYPMEYYCAALQKYDPKTKGFDLLKEAIEMGVDILPPHPAKSQETWSIEKTKKGKPKGLRAGLTQIRGIAEKIAPVLLDFRESFLRLNDTIEWDDYLAVSGIGPAKIAAFKEFSADDDPFGVYRLGIALKKVRWHLYEEGEITGLPYPSSKSEDVPYENIRGQHVWAGFVIDRNLKDIYELHRSRTGDELDPATVKEPQYVNYVVITGEDETGPLVITVHRYGGLYERFKDLIWDMDVKRDVLLVKGYKRSEYRRAIYATDLWVINPDKIKG